MPRKTIEIRSLVENLNNLLKDPEILEIQKEVICGIIEGILEKSENPFEITRENQEKEFSRMYIIK